MDAEPDGAGTGTLAACGYCGRAVHWLSRYMIVNTLVGAVRLCDKCATREPYAYEVHLAAWLEADAVPKRWRAAQERANRRKHD